MSILQVVGWGRTVSNDDESDVLLHNDLLIMDRQFCLQIVLRTLFFDKFCGAKNGGKTMFVLL